MIFQPFLIKHNKYCAKIPIASGATVAAVYDRRWISRSAVSMSRSNSAASQRVAFFRNLLVIPSPRASAGLGPQGSERGLYEPQQAGKLPARCILQEPRRAPRASSFPGWCPRAQRPPRVPERGPYEPQQRQIFLNDHPPPHVLFRRSQSPSTLIREILKPSALPWVPFPN